MHPQGEKKLFGVIYRVNCKCIPTGRAKSQFLRKFCWAKEGWRVVVVNLAVLACVLRTATKKGHQFWRKKGTPQKILATPMPPLSRAVEMGF